MGRPNLAANYLSPTFYGSLPKALSQEERLSISRNTPMSASLREVRSQTPVRQPALPALLNLFTTMMPARPCPSILKLIARQWILLLCRH
jgi:hypothetical protein